MHRRRLTGRKLGREKAPRKALMRSLITSLILYEKMDTTKAKAKETQRIVEKLITEAQKGTLSATRRVDSYLLNKNAAKKLMTEIAPIYKDRKGGYTRVINLNPRVGDSAAMARIELLDTDKILKTVEDKEKTKKDKKPAKGKKEETKKAPKKEVKEAKKETKTKEKAKK